MKMVVTGGAGFVGRHVAAAVLEAGHECVVFDAAGIPRELADRGVRQEVGSLSSIEELRRAFRGADVVLHLAGVGDVYLAAEKPWLAAESNVLGSANVAEACLAEGVGRLIYASTWEVYGHPVYEPLDEQHPTNPDHPYNVTKLAGEQLLMTYDALRGLSVVALRLGTAYGTGMRANSVFSVFITRALRGEAITVSGDGRQHRQFTHGVRTLVSVRSMLSGQQEVVDFRWPLVRCIHAHGVRFLARCCYPCADGVVTVSDGAASDIAHLTGLPLSRITVIRNPVIRPQLFSRAAERVTHPWLAGDGPPVILGVGRLHRIKDFATLIKAFSLVRRQREARLVILGDGPERNSLLQFARERGVAADVDLPGFTGNPYPAMRAAAVLALTSRFDALPGVLIEALALGIPIVATDCPSGPREILRGGRYGELAPVGDAAGVAAAILRVLDGRSAAGAADPEWLDQFREETAMYRYLQLLADDAERVAGEE